MHLRDLLDLGSPGTTGLVLNDRYFHLMRLALNAMSVEVTPTVCGYVRGTGLPEAEAGRNSRGASGKQFLDFKAAKQVARGLQLRNQKAWIELCSSGALPHGVPSNPPVIYNSEWRSWSDWLGCDRGWR